MVIEQVPTRNLEPNQWNPNRMPEDLYQALKAHMEKGGKVDPLIVIPKPIYGYLIVDGEHRWRAATELGWKTIPCEVMALTEDEAKREGYQRNKFRGTMDVYREAELFASILEKLGTQQKLAEFLGVSQQLVASRLSILKTHDKVRRLYSITPRGVMTPSHLESIATLPEGRQVEVASEVVEQGLSVQTTERRVQQEKRILEREDNLRKAVEASEHKTCPECRAEPEMASFQGLPWVHCKGKDGSWQKHEWSLETGQTLEQYREAQRRKERASKPREGEEPRPPRSFRYKATPDEMGRKLTKRVLQMMRDITAIQTLRVTGSIKVGEKTEDVTIDLVAPHKAAWTGTENLSYSESYSERVGGRPEKERAVTVFAEAKEYKKWPEDKSLVAGDIYPLEGVKGADEYERAVRMLEALRRFLEEL